MNPLQTLRVAGRALMRNKLRSLLTTLGVVIGVGAVIAMVALGEGARAKVEASFASMGANLLIILPGSMTAGGARGGFGSGSTLTWDDLKAIQGELQSSVLYAAPQLRGSAQIVSEDTNWATSVTGTSPDYFLIRSWPCSEGAVFTKSDIEGSNKVVVLGATVAENLFGQGVDPVGETVRIKNIPFTVVGLLARKGQSPTGQDYDDGAFVPYTTFQTKIQGGPQKFIAGGIFISAAPGQVSRAQEQISTLLRDRHRTAENADNDFSIRNMAEMASEQQESAQTLAILLASIAAVSLLVGGIGIMNIMLVSVTERTREIGIRMAIGARPRDILLQFLVEALSLSMLGGLLGLLVGIGGAWVGTRLGWPTVIRPEVAAIAMGFSAFIGVVFGLYPARKASQLDPIDALRFE
ncbi:MAG: ABC transporter permease [Archangiaceae bacterium]|nr:ABC transporter permease [Archangiaceae bacterium]